MPFSCYRFAFIAFVFLTVASPKGQANAQPFDEVREVTAVRVFDGDTITAKSHSEEIKIRLYGVDAPEGNQPWGNDSKLFLEDLLLGETIVIRTLYLDRYGRYVAIAALPTGEVVQELMLAKGHLMVYPKYCDIPKCAVWRKLEQQAREDRVGQWQKDGVIEPWVWIRSRFYAE